MTVSQKYRIEDLIEQIEKVQKMIMFNSTNLKALKELEAALVV